MRFIKTLILGFVAILFILSPVVFGQTKPAKVKMTQHDIVELVLSSTKPLKYQRGNRLPLYLWSLHGLGTEDDAEAERLLRALEVRGLPVIATWNPQRREQTLKEGLKLGQLQKKLGLPITVSANACLHYFCNGEKRTAHIGYDGKSFFDFSFDEKRPMGCPFELGHRCQPIRDQLEPFLDAYRQAGLEVNFIFVDWEIDGPIEGNDAWSHSKRCKRCRENIPDINDYSAFRKALRTIRCRIQRECFAEPVLKRFPKALVGNYAVYPNDGYRYWYDYFEKLAPDAPFQADQRAKYRPWFQEFSLTGYTVSMPVVYTWYATATWYDFADHDYRWFYNLLTVASTSGKHKVTGVPSIPFVHWHTTSPPKEPDPAVKQFSSEKYQELLWHMLLRGHDTFFLWCPRDETAEEARLLHEVWAASLEYSEFLEKGTPVCFDVPREQGPVVSSLQLGDQLLVRRTDFDDRRSSVSLTVGGKPVPVPRSQGRCLVLRLE